MDWASTEWKQALSPLAVQKVTALEVKIEKLQKERQQKQLQLECQELALEKEKRKSEKEKQHSSVLQKELQSLADACKDLENKQQKLQNELQSRDSRIKNLETLLSQSRKENSKLQQLESDLKDLSYVRENAISVREQKLQKKLHLFEQSTTQEQKSILDSSIDNHEAKEHALIDNSEIQRTLEKKIKEQEELIKELKTKLCSASRIDDVPDPSNVFKTQKSMSVTDSPVVHGKKVLNVDTFSSTPAKGNKDRVLGYGDSFSIDSGDEKLVSRLQQLRQELECQRHNSEASKNAMELKYKESESTLKEDLKYQIQANTKLDKELKESRNKHQQEITQTMKKLDMLTLELKRSEEKKVACERDLKSLESKISMNESELRSKEEELQELQKSKNANEATQQTLQSKIRELEKNCRALTEEKSSLSENVRATRMQLEGSNNLVKEKEINLYNSQQELTNLQLRMKELENNFTTQAERFNESQKKEILIAEQLEFLTQDKKELNDSLNSEIKRNQNAESRIEEQKQSILLLKEELNKKALSIDELKEQKINLDNEYQVKLSDLKNEFHSVKHEHDALQNALLESTSLQASMKNKIQQLEEANKNLSNDISAEKDRSDCLNLNLEAETQKMLSLKEELASTCLKFEELQNQMNSSRNGLENELLVVNATLKTMEEEKSKFNNKVEQLEGFIAKEELDSALLKEKLENKCIEFDSMKVLKEEHENELQEVNATLKSMEDEKSKFNNKVEQLESVIAKEELDSALLKEKLESKCIEFDFLEEEHKNKIKELNDLWNSSQSLENELNTVSLNANNMKEKLDLSEQEKLELCNQLKLKMSEVEQLEFSIKKEKEDASLLKEQLNIKWVEFENFTNQIKILKREHEINKHKLEQDLCEVSLKKVSLIDKMGQTEGLNKELSDNISAEKSKNEFLKLSLEQETEKKLSLKEELVSKCMELKEFQNEMKISGNQYENKIKELNDLLKSKQAELTSLENELNTVSLNANNMKEKLDLSEQEKLELCNQLKLKMSEVEQLEFCIKKEKEDTSSLKEQLNIKHVECEDFTNRIKILENEHETNNQELEVKLHTAQQELSVSKNQLHASSLMEASLKAKIQLLEESNEELSDNLSAESNKNNCLKLNSEEESCKVLALEEEVASKSLKLKEYESQIEVSRKKFESEIQEFISASNSSQAKITFLEAELNTSSSSESDLKKKLVSIEQEKLELWNHLNMKTSEVQQLKLFIEKGKEDFTLLKEKLESKCVELGDMKNQVTVLKECEANSSELKQKFHFAIEQLGKLQNELHESSLTEVSLKEKVKDMEISNKELSDKIRTDNDRTKCLQLNLQEKGRKMLALNEERSSKSLELEELKNEIVLSENQFKSDIQALEDQLEAAISNKNAFEEKLQTVEQEKSELSEQLEQATLEVQELKSSFENEKRTSCLLAENLASYSVQINELLNQMKILSTTYKAEAHEFKEKLSTVEAKSILLERKMKEKRELLNQLVSATTKIQKLELSIEEEKQVCSMLKKELAHYCVELEKLNNQNKNSKEMLDRKVLELETKMSSVAAKSMALETILKEISTRENIENDKNKLLNQVASATLKIQELNECIEKEKKVCSLLNEDLQNKCLEVEDLKRETKVLMEEHKEAILKIENIHSSSKAEKMSLENELEEHASKIRLLMLEKDELAACLITERGKNQSLELSLENWKAFVISLDESLSSVETEGRAIVKEISISKKFYEDKVEKLENELSLLQFAHITLKYEREESTLNEIGLEQQLDILIKDKDNLTSEVAKVACKCIQFEETTQERQTEILELVEKLSHSESHTAALELKLKEHCQIEVSLKEELSQVKNENVKLADRLGEKTEEVEMLNSCIQNIKKELFSTEKKMSLKSDELRDLSVKEEEAIKEYKNKIQDLEKSLLAAQSSEIDFQNQLLQYASREESLTASVAVLEKENIDATEKLKLEKKKREELQLSAQQLAESCASFEEELSNTVLLLGEANTLTNEFQNKIKDLESSLFTNQTNHQNHLQDCSMNEKNLKSSLTILEKENVEMSEKLTAELLKTEKLELLVEEQNKSCATLTEQLEEVNRQKAMVLDESRRTIQNLQDGISDVQSKNVILGKEVKCHLLNEQNLKKSLDSIAKEKQIIHNQLSVEASKIRILETGIGDLKRMIMALQVVLLCNNDDTNWAYSKKPASKDLYKDLGYQRNVQSPDKSNWKSTTLKKSLFALESMPIRNPAVDCKKVDFEEMALIQSCKEIEHSQALHKLALHFLEEINSLEQGLIAKVEMLQFLHCYKLFEKKELACLWKKFLLLTKLLQMIQFLKKFMSCVCNILKSNIVSCKFDNGVKKLSTSLLSSEKSHLSTQDIFYLCGDTLNKVLFSVSQTLQQNEMVSKQCSIDKYSTVHSNQLPVITNTKFLIYLHHLSRSYISSELRSFKQNPCIKMDPQNVQNVLSVLKIQDVPYFMNYAVALTKYIEDVCSGTNNVLQLHPPSTNFSTSTEHIFKQYHLNCLDTDNDGILTELNYWKKHCRILGITECDIEKTIPLFGCKSKNNDVPSETTKDPSTEIDSLREECSALQNAVLEEKEKQLLLNATIEEIEQDLGETFQLKEKYMKMVFETSKVLKQLKENIGAANSFFMIKLKNELSCDFCYCEMCVQQEESEDHNSQDKLTLASLFECIEKLVELGNQVETKLLESNQQETKLSSMYKDLQDRNSELEMAVASLNAGSKEAHDEIESLKYELLKEKENYQHICQTADKKDSIILKLESTNSDLSIVNKVKLACSEEKIRELSRKLEELSAVLSSREGEIKDLKKATKEDALKFENSSDVNKVKLACSEETIQELSRELEELSAVLSSKEVEIEALKKAIEEEALKFESAQLQCKEYESKIQLLNSTISKFEEEKALDKHLNSFADGNSKKTISELQDKIESLKKANDSLNLTIETIEDELRTVYSEKQNVEELEKLTEQNMQLEDEVTNATQKYACEQQANKELLSKLETCEKLKVTSDNAVNDLRRKNEVLDKDVSLLKGVLRDHEQAILSNNSSLKLKDQVIDRLNLKVSEMEQENLDLNMQLEDNVNTASPLKLQLKELTEQCCIFEEEIKRLKLGEVEKVMLLKNLHKMELQRNGLVEDANSLRVELEKVNEWLAHHEKTHKELTLKNKETCEDLNKEIALRNSLEKDLSNKENEITDLKDRFQKLKTTTHELGLLNSKQGEENKVLSQQCKDYQETVEEVTKILKTKTQQTRTNEDEKLIAELKETRSTSVANVSDFNNLKRVFTNAIQFIVNILDITIHSIKSDSSNPESQKLKPSLLSALLYWRQCSVTVPETDNKFNEMFDNLRYFYGIVANKREEERAIHSHVKSIIYTLTSIGQFCETLVQKYQTSRDADVTIVSMFETTIVQNLAKVNLLPTSIVTELQQIKELVDEYFNSMKCTINKQTEEMEIFKVKLNEISVLQVSSGAECEEKVKSSYNWKYNLIKLSYQKLEKDYNKLAKTCEEMEKRVKTLEKDNQSLEEEAEELASDYKKIEEQLYNSNELAETLTKLGQTQQQLQESKNENNWLRRKLQFCSSNHGKKAVLGISEGASHVLATAEYKENVQKNGSDKLIS